MTKCADACAIISESSSTTRRTCRDWTAFRMARPAAGGKRFTTETLRHREIESGSAPDFHSAPASSWALLLLLHVDAGDGVFPIQLQHGRGRARLVQRDGEHLHARWQLSYLHVHPRQVLAFAVFRAPLAGLLVDDQLPAIHAGQGVKGIAARRDVGAADGQVSVGLEAGCCVRSGTPDLAVRHKSAEYLPSAHGRTTVLDGDRLSVIELYRRLARRAERFFLLRHAGCRAYGDGKHGEHP